MRGRQREKKKTGKKKKKHEDERGTGLRVTERKGEKVGLIKWRKKRVKCKALK